MAVMLVAPAAAQVTGPSTSVTPYLVPTAPGVEFTSILSVGDTARRKHKGDDSYRMVGIPDGLGAYDNGDGSFTVLMNHELGASAGVVRAHGGKGAFISKWQIRKSDLKVLNGEDLVRRIYLWNGSSYAEATDAVFARLCSADLPAASAFFNPASGLGLSEGRIFMNGEENGPSGRVFAHLIRGVGNTASYELPRFGKASWENAVASPFAQDKTVVAGLDDGSIGASKVYLYVGDKQAHGNPVDRAGLTNGQTFQVAIAGIAAKEDEIVQGDRSARAFTLVASGGTGFNRVEDGAWDPRNPNVFYFATTASFTGNSRLWRLTFNDVRTPEAGGLIEVALDGGSTVGSGPKMMDNLTIDGDGHVLLQEDPGNQAYLAKVWKFNPVNRELRELAAFDPGRFTAGVTGFITQDEESSGVVEVTDLFAGVTGYDTAAYRYFLLDAQVHKNIAAAEPELVELGQLLLMRVAR